MDVVIVESPAKAKTINKYLGSGYQVMASYGHIRDLPGKDGSVRPDDGFAMSWEVDSKSKKRINEIASAVKDADRLILATDPDREGEAISWHVLEVLRKKGVLKEKQVERVVFNAITKNAILDAMDHPREIDTPLVDAYLARRALDYLVGFSLSPVLWRKLPGARSAGRVQSVALRLICDREAEIERFVLIEYWSLTAMLETVRNDKFEARLVLVDGKRLEKHGIGNEKQATSLKTALAAARYQVRHVESKPVKRHPYAPFTTSTLQQEASRKLGFAAQHTMRVAQRLYEGVNIGGETQGLITYMRTDGVQIADEAIAATRDVIRDEFGERYVPEKWRVYRSKAKNAQEAHEAIRPTSPSRKPSDVSKLLEPDQAKLYELIWKRTVASQMESAELERTTVDIDADAGGTVHGLRATGTVTRFDGFLSVYQEGRDDDDKSEDGKRLPQINQGEGLKAEKVEANRHFTEPRPRFTEATLIRRMEELGIGRPSTYTATLAVLRDREYVHLDKKRLVPEAKGRLVTAFLESFFQRYVQYDFTADIEQKLDRISAGEIGWQDVLREFWTDFTGALEGTSDLRVAQVLDALNDMLQEYVFPRADEETNPRTCPTCSEGQLSLKLGKFGAFVGCSNYPECRYTRQLTGSQTTTAAGSDGEHKLLGEDPETGKPVTLRSGRFGPFVQLGEAENGEKPKRASIPKGWPPEDVDLAQALALLSLPREIGKHPESGNPISAGIGRYRPFVEHERVYASLDSVEEVFSVGVNRAVTLLAEKAVRGGRRAAPKVIKELGDHADFGGPITVRDGRYGPYVSDGKINATLPRGTEPQGVTLDQAVELLAAKKAAGGKGRKRSRAKS